MDITGANAVLTLAISTILPVPTQIQQFAADDVYDFDAIQSVETVMGVDGVLSGGWTWKPQQQTIMLMADSPSNQLFDTWFAQMKAAQTIFIANGIVALPAIRTKFIMTNGQLTDYKLPGVKKLVQPRRYGITWNDVIVAPI